MSASKSKVIAVIMAGGEGKRLYPLTERCPKPLLPVAGTPIIERIISSLLNEGIDDITVTSGFMASRLEEYIKGSEALSNYKGAKISFSRENRPLGSAGAVKRAIKHRDFDKALIVSGDGLYIPEKMTFSAFTKGCEAIGGDAFILSKEELFSERFGIICEKNGAVTSFAEKPTDYVDRGKKVLINTGIYLLSKRAVMLIDDGFCDFGRDFFPRLLMSHERVGTLIADGYFCDIGTTSDYYRCNMYLSKGESCINGMVERGATVCESVILNGATIKRGAVLDRCIIGENVTVKEGVKISPSCVVGEGSVISSDLSEGLTVTPRSCV